MPNINGMLLKQCRSGGFTGDSSFVQLRLFVAADDQQAALQQVAHSRTAVCVCTYVRACGGPLLRVYKQGLHCPVPLPHEFTQLTVLSLPPNTHTKLPVWNRNRKSNLSLQTRENGKNLQKGWKMSALYFIAAATTIACY